MKYINLQNFPSFSFCIKIGNIELYFVSNFPSETAKALEIFKFTKFKWNNTRDNNLTNI